MTFREGAIGASVWRRQTKAGGYYDFTLSRCFQQADGSFGYSSCFYASHADALKAVIRRATSWMREQRDADRSPAASENEKSLMIGEGAYE